MKIKKLLVLLSLIPFYTFSAPDTIELYGNKNTKSTQSKEVSSVKEKTRDFQQSEIIKSTEIFEIKGGNTGKEDLQKMREALKPKIEKNNSIEKKIKSKIKEKPPELPFLPNFVDIAESPVKKNKTKNNKAPIDKNLSTASTSGLITYDGSSTYKNNEKESGATFINSKLLKKMQQLYDKLTDLGLPMKVYIVDENNPVVKNFVKKNILKKNSYDYRDAFISELSISAKINNSNIPVCYIYPKDNISVDYNKFIKDLYSESYKGKLNEDQILKFLLGKELAYCLDSLERENYLNNNKLIYAKEAYKIGINSNLFGKEFAYGLRNDEYDPKKFFNNNIQLIYQNMATDAFGFLLSYNSKYENNHFINYYYNHDYIKRSKYVKNLSKEIKNVIKKDALKNKKISELWKIARNIQVNNLNK